MNTIKWYYNEMDRVENELKCCQDEQLRGKLESKLDKLHDEFYDLDDE